MLTPHTAVIKNKLDDVILEMVEIRIEHDFFIDSRHQMMLMKRHQIMLMKIMETYANESIVYDDLACYIYFEKSIKDLIGNPQPNLIIESDVVSTGGSRYINFYIGKTPLRSYKLQGGLKRVR